MSFKQPLTLTVATLATLLSTTINAETVEGLLEKVPPTPHSLPSACKSGDFVGYAVKTNPRRQSHPEKLPSRHVVQG